MAAPHRGRAGFARATVYVLGICFEFGPTDVLEQGSRKVERARLVQLAELGEQRLELDAAVSGRERFQPAQGLRELPLGADPASAPGLVPRHRDMHQALEEVALFGRRRAPRILELLVRGEVLAGSDELHSGPIRGLEVLADSKFSVFHPGATLTRA